MGDTEWRARVAYWAHRAAKDPGDMAALGGLFGQLGGVENAYHLAHLLAEVLPPSDWRPAE